MFVVHGLVANLQGDGVGLVLLALFPLGKDLALPFLVAFAVKVSVRLVLHLVGGSYGFVGFQPVLGAVGCMRYLVLDGIGILKLFFQELPGLGVGLEVERVGQEVVRRRILVHAAYQIGHGIQEMFVLHYRCVQNHVVAQFRLGTPYMVGHALEHLKAEAILGCAVLLCEQVSIGDGVHVVRSHTDMEVFGILGQQTALDDMQIVGIYLCLVGAYGVLPSSQRGHYRFHLQVASLHDTHLDGCTAA